MYALTQVSGKPVKGLTEFYCDDVNDIKDLPTEGIAPGSTAIVIASGRVFILNCSMKWVSPKSNNLELDKLQLNQIRRDWYGKES